MIPDERPQLGPQAGAVSLGARCAGVDMKNAEPETALRSRRTRIQKLRDRSDKLGWRERLGQKEAVRDAMRGPLVGTGTGHVFTVRSNRLI